MTNSHNSSPLFHIPIDLIDARNDQRYSRESQERRHNCKSPESASSAESKHGLAVPVAEGRVKSKAGGKVSEWRKPDYDEGDPGERRQKAPVPVRGQPGCPLEPFGDGLGSIEGPRVANYSYLIPAYPSSARNVCAGCRNLQNVLLWWLLAMVHPTSYN